MFLNIIEIFIIRPQENAEINLEPMKRLNETKVYFEAKDKSI